MYSWQGLFLTTSNSIGIFTKNELKSTGKNQNSFIIYDKDKDTSDAIHFETKYDDRGITLMDTYEGSIITSKHDSTKR